jgi:hypothetical protein
VALEERVAELGRKVVRYAGVDAYPAERTDRREIAACD